MDDYFAPHYVSAKGNIFLFPCYLVRTTDEIEHPWCISSHGDFLGVWRSNVVIFWSTQHSPTPEQRGTITTLNLVTLGMEILGFADNSI